MNENATTLGLAVHGYLTKSELTVQAPTSTLETRLATLLDEIEHLQAVGLISETQRQAIVDTVPQGSIPEAVEDPQDSHPVGTVLLTTARRYNPYFSGAYDVVVAMSAVTTAAIAAFAHSGPEAALVCASVAAVRAIADAGHKREVPVDAVLSLDGHKEGEHPDAGHKRTATPA